MNVTWPGYVGALTASAPGRFASAIDQAPLGGAPASRVAAARSICANAISTLLRLRAIP